MPGNFREEIIKTLSAAKKSIQLTLQEQARASEIKQLVQLEAFKLLLTKSPTTLDALSYATQFTDENNVKALKALLTSKSKTLISVSDAVAAATKFTDENQVRALELLSKKDHHNDAPLTPNEAIEEANKYTSTPQVNALKHYISAFRGAENLKKATKLDLPLKFESDSQVDALELFISINRASHQLASSLSADDSETTYSLQIENASQLEALKKFLPKKKSPAETKAAVDKALQFKTDSQYKAWEHFSFENDKIKDALEIKTESQFIALTSKLEMNSTLAAQFTQDWHLTTLATLFEQVAKQIPEFNCSEQGEIWLKDGLNAALQYNCTGVMAIGPDGELA